MSQLRSGNNQKAVIYSFTIIDDSGLDLKEIMVDANDVLDSEIWLASYGHYPNPEVKLMATDEEGDDVIYFFEVSADPAALH